MRDITGRVLRIEKISIHDGKGLRTVVFLKGCPLKCKWCSTPESQSFACSHGYGYEESAAEIVKTVCKDEIFFFHSGGGVTISGGEVLMQADFAQAILEGCLEQGIPTAIETSLYADYTEIGKLLPCLDEIYIDFKLFDENQHKIYTGVSNRKIKDNLLRLDQEFFGPIHIRIPCIPTVNMTEENMRQTAGFVKQLKNAVDIELLPYHRLGLDTYEKLGMNYALKEIATPSMEVMGKMAAVVKACVPELAVKVKGELLENISDLS